MSAGEQAANQNEALGRALSVFTIGHSNKSVDLFLSLLAQHAVEVVVDIRSNPFSKYATQFDLNSLGPVVKQAGLKFLFLGRELGGKPKEPAFYDDDGHLLYAKVAQSQLFQEAIERLKRGVASYRVALMCSEEDPTNCHRRLLVGRVLRESGVAVQHIRGTGAIQTEEDLAGAAGPKVQQMSIFANRQDGDEWRSAKAIMEPAQWRDLS